MATTTQTRAWSTIRKTANERGFFARQMQVDGKGATVYCLFDSNMQVRLCTRSRAALERAVYAA